MEFVDLLDGIEVPQAKAPRQRVPENMRDPKRVEAAKKALATRRARNIAYYENILRQAGRGTLSRTELSNAALGYLKMRGGYRGRSFTSEEQVKAFTQAYKDLIKKLNPVYRKKPLNQGLRDWIAEHRSVNAPWYWNLSAVRSSGTGEGGQDRAIVNAAYREGLKQAMADFANEWARSGKQAPIHGWY